MDSSDSWGRSCNVRYFEENREKYKSQNGDREEYNMCQALREIREDFFNEGKAEGRAEGREQEKRNIIREMLQDHIPDYKIKQYTGATDKEISEEKSRLF